MAGLLHGLDKEFLIERGNGEKVYNLCLDAVLLLKLCCCLKRRAHHRTIRDYGEIFALPHELRFADGHALLFLRDFLTECPIDGLSLIKDDGIWITDGANEKCPGIAGS